MDIITILTKRVPFGVRGYQSSTGSVTDFVFRFCGRSGYLRLAEESLSLLDQAVAATYAAHPRYAGTNEAALGAQSLREGLELRLRDRERPAWSAKEQLAPQDGEHGCVFYKDNDPELVVIMRLEALSRSVIKDGKAGLVQKLSAAHFSALVAAQLPCSRYEHRLNLYPGKFVSVIEHDSDTP